MLNLRRAANESVLIRCPDGNVLRVLVAQFQVPADRGKVFVNLGIDAPRDYLIAREELTKNGWPGEAAVRKA